MTAVDVAVRVHEDYVNRIGLAMGMFTMLTTQEGHHYGEELGALQTEYAEWVRQQTRSYNRNRADNPGRRKYNARRHRMEERLHSYINQELRNPGRSTSSECPGQRRAASTGKSTIPWPCGREATSAAAWSRNAESSRWKSWRCWGRTSAMSAAAAARWRAVAGRKGFSSAMPAGIRRRRRRILPGTC